MVTWDNQPETIKHLNDVQKARCAEFVICLMRFTHKYPHFLPASVSLSWSVSSWWSLPSWSLLSLTSSEWPLPDNEHLLYKDKYNRLLNSKKAYEEAGGYYD